uniref:ACB domain-containing protein n=1 Tax=Plectus sambesii TaxID=2011161 RepID=A0A914VAF4_9BILA
MAAVQLNGALPNGNVGRQLNGTVKIGQQQQQQIDVHDDIADRFHAAVKIIHSLPKDGPLTTSNLTKLRFYALYKQATVGSCKGSRPGFWNVVERVKWDAWHRLEGMSEHEAMRKYIDGLREVR